MVSDSLGVAANQVYDDDDDDDDGDDGDDDDDGAWINVTPEAT